MLEKSTSIFAGLRDLPQTGKSWQPYFQKAFEVYTKLWKFQQQQRAVLEKKEYFGLKRFEIGEIASKIGQLYYHYYLRTSETNYLFESYVFYEAIGDRAYFKDVLTAGTPALVIKKLRYYARYIVASLLLNKHDTIRVLIDELAELVESYTKIYKPTDSGEWSLVLSEITTFVNIERSLAPASADKHIPATPVRLQSSGSGAVSPLSLRLQEAVLVGNCAHQTKFSELTIDMYRMLQSLEREPTVMTKAAANDESVPKAKRSQPHKYLLYKPTFYQLLVYLATAFKDIAGNGALLLYISADAGLLEESSVEDAGLSKGAFSKGVQTARPSKPQQGSGGAEEEDSDAPGQDKANSLYPGDLVSFSRKPFFVIVDSPSSHSFQAFSSPFREQTVILMSPAGLPRAYKSLASSGSPFTLFLHSPLKALRYLGGESVEISLDTWNEAYTKVTQLESFAKSLLLENGVPDAISLFMQDDFSAAYLARYLLSSVVFRAHVEFSQEGYYPAIYPAISDELVIKLVAAGGVQELVSSLGLSSSFDFSKLSTAH